MRAVLYLRMSRDSQDRSIGEQRDAINQYATKLGYKIVGEYVDEGISGDATEKRLAFQRMIADCSAKKFEIILAWDQDRFGRFDPLEAGYWVKPMRDAGVVLETVAQGKIDWNDFAGRLLYTVTQEAKHAFLRDLARNSLRGNIERAKRGQSAGRIPFGYDQAEDGRYILGDLDAVATVRRIFELRLLRYGYRSIATMLNAENRPSPSGKAWSFDSVRIVLNRESYTGTLTYATRHRGKYQTTIDGAASLQTGKTRRNANPIRVPNSHPPIVELDTWLRCQAIKSDAPKPHSSRGNSGAPLAGLLFCGRCGAAMFAQSLQKKSGQRNPNYICGNYHRGNGCGYCVVNQDWIHEMVARELQKLVNDLGATPEAIEERLTKIDASKKFSIDLTAKKRQFEKLEKQISDATDRLLIVNARLVPELESRILAMRDKQTALTAALAVPENQSPVSLSRVAKWIAMLPGIFNQYDAARVRATVKRIYSKIVLEFAEGKKTGRGQSFICVGIRFEDQPSKPWDSPMRTTLF